MWLSSILPQGDSPTVPVDCGRGREVCIPILGQCISFRQGPDFSTAEGGAQGALLCRAMLGSPLDQGAVLFLSSALVVGHIHPGPPPLHLLYSPLCAVYLQGTTARDELISGVVGELKKFNARRKLKVGGQSQPYSLSFFSTPLSLFCLSSQWVFSNFRQPQPHPPSPIQVVTFPPQPFSASFLFLCVNTDGRGRCPDGVAPVPGHRRGQRRWCLLFFPRSLDRLGSHHSSSILRE